MSEEDAFLQQIFANPADDTVRLVYADWLQDHGREPRAQLIRKQIEGHNIYPGIDYTTLAPWVAPLPDAGDDDPFAIMRVDTYPKPLTLEEFDRKPRAGFFWRRGFVRMVECEMKRWYLFGNSLLGRHPIEEVQFTDLEPQVSIVVLEICRKKWPAIRFTEEPLKFGKMVEITRRSLFAPFRLDAPAMIDPRIFIKPGAV